jgi:hypothetical protein
MHSLLSPYVANQVITEARAEAARERRAPRSGPMVRFRARRARRSARHGALVAASDH